VSLVSSPVDVVLSLGVGPRCARADRPGKCVFCRGGWCG